MPFLAPEKRLAVLAALVDGNSVRATSRMTDVNLRTVLRFGVTLGEGAQRLHNALAVRALTGRPTAWTWPWLTPAERAVNRVAWVIGGGGSWTF